MDPTALIEVNPTHAQEVAVLALCQHDMVAIPHYLVQAAERAARDLGLTNVSPNDVMVVWMRRGLLEYQQGGGR